MRSLDAGGFYINFIEKYTTKHKFTGAHSALTQTQHTHMRIKAEK